MRHIRSDRVPKGTPEADRLKKIIIMLVDCDTSFNFTFDIIDFGDCVEVNVYEMD